MDKKEQARIRKQRQRDRERDKPIENVTQEPQSVTPNVTQYHPIMYALTDPIKRQKLERVCESLKRHNVLDKVFYGCGRHSIPFDEVGELLEVTAIAITKSRQIRATAY